MSTTKKLAIAVIALSLALVAFAGVSLAWLVSTPDAVVNTFTVGNIVITLDEAPVDANGKETTGNRVTSNTYKIIPGSEYDKDPTVHVAAESEACYVYVRISNPLAPIIDGTSIEEQLTQNSWIPLTGFDGVYYIEVDSDDASAGIDLLVFDGFKISGDVSNKPGSALLISAYEDKQIVVTAYAVQSANMDDAVDAWTKAFGN